MINRARNELHGDIFLALLEAIIVYEQIAFASGGRVPTITTLNRRSKRVLGLVISGVLAAHFIWDSDEDYERRLFTKSAIWKAQGQEH